MMARRRYEGVCLDVLTDLKDGKESVCATCCGVRCVGRLCVRDRVADCKVFAEGLNSDDKKERMKVYAPDGSSASQRL